MGFFLTNFLIWFDESDSVSVSGLVWCDCEWLINVNDVMRLRILYSTLPTYLFAGESAIPSQHSQFWVIKYNDAMYTDTKGDTAYWQICSMLTRRTSSSLETQLEMFMRVFTKLNITPSSATVLISIQDTRGRKHTHAIKFLISIPNCLFFLSQ